jgi:hypothetical protein
LMAEGERRGRYYIASPRLRQIGRESEAGENKRFEDPFHPQGYLPGIAPSLI